MIRNFREVVMTALQGRIASHAALIDEPRVAGDPAASGQLHHFTIDCNAEISFGNNTPCSVMNAVTYSAGVISNAGL